MKTISSFVLAVLCFSAFTIVDPFGFASATGYASQQLTYRVMSLVRPAKGAGQAAVVLIDDDSILRLYRETGYPISFNEHARKLRHVLCAGPAALFIDLSFRGMRGDSAPTATPARQGPQAIDPALAQFFGVLRDSKPSAGDEFCRLPDPGRFHAVSEPKVRIARVRSHTNDREPAGKDGRKPCDPFYAEPPDESCRFFRAIDQLRQVAKPVSAGRITEDGAYVLAGTDPGGDASRLEPSPALQMVFDFCDAAARSGSGERSNLPGCRDRARLETLLRSAPDDARLQLVPVWSFYQTRTWIRDARYAVDSTQATGRTSANPPARKACARQNPEQAGIWDKLAIASHEIWRSLFHFGGKVEDGVFGGTMCIPTDTLSLYKIHDIAMRGGDGAQDLSQDRFASFFAGRMVFYGAQITGINDTFRTPVVGLLPGVAFHAAVAENLLSLGADYAHAPAPVARLAGLDLVTTGQLADIGIFASIALLLVLLKSALRDEPASVPPWLTRSLRVLMALLVAAALLAGIGSLVLAHGVGLPLFTLICAGVTLATLAVSGGALAFSSIGAERTVLSIAARIGMTMLVAVPMGVALAYLAQHVWHLPPVNILTATLFTASLAFSD